MTTRQTPDETTVTDEDDRGPLVFPDLKIPFVLLVLCFAAWGSAANLSEVMVSVFRSIFTMTNFESALVTFAYYGAYFLLALPAAFINRRFGYKVGVLTGLGLAAVGGFLFLPASEILVYGVFLCALFVLAAGLSILETSANPFVIAMGPERTATQRLNLAQAFNPVGANVGVLLGAVVILPRLTPAEEKQGMSPDQLLASQEADLSLVLGPYLGIAAVLVLIWLLIAFRRMENPQEEHEHEHDASDPAARRGALGRLLSNPHYRWGVVAQFFNIGAQVSTWSFTIIYARDVVGVSEASAGWYLQASLILFLISRFVMTYLLGIFRPTRLLLIMATAGVALALVGVLLESIIGLVAVICLSACLSLMFPTIYGVALSGLGDDTKFGAAGLVMAILGGALVPPVQALVADWTGNQAVSFLVTALCFAVVGAYALFDLRSDPHGNRVVVTGGGH